ncbi:MAG: hybrid sensor histidine kinase/response regulator [Rhodospirillales bacterium]|nr:hybrid sensor histidine kinase/response regulator [Rhodospirillales bacterium]
MSLFDRWFRRDPAPPPVAGDLKRALEQAQRRFERFFDIAPVGILLLDRAGTVTETNLAMTRMLGMPGGGLAGKRLIELLEPKGAGELVTALAEIQDGAERAEPFEVRLVGDGRNVVVQLFARRAGVEIDGREGGAGLILHAVDLTEQKNLETQFAQSQKMQAVGQLAGGIAHDFNNLLTAMIGFCDLLLLRHKPGDPSFGDIMQIKQSANRAANLVRQLLAFSRQQTLQPRVIDVTDVLAELSHLLRRLIGENIDLDLVHGRELGLVKVDQGQLEQVLINLVVNARDAMPTGGRLQVRTSNLETAHSQLKGLDEMPPGRWVTIQVSDTGIGIGRENLTRIFEPFFSTKEVGAGTGLGLSTVYGIVRQTGGYVQVDSQLGHGARFTIYLPRHADTVTAEPAPAEAAEARSQADLTGAGGILLVEDEDAVRTFSARALRNKGYKVWEANSGENALEIFEQEQAQIDLVVTDVIMPNMDGPTMARRVREVNREIKVIFISGYTEDRFRQHLDIDAGTHFLAKPFSLKQLAGKVKEVMTGEIDS